jgi:hypothetical protein
MITFLYLGGLAAVVGLALGLLVATTPRRLGVVLLIGLAIAAIWFAFAFFGAETDPNHRPDCSDCSYTWGRWWEPPLVIALLVINLAAWVLGAVVGWAVRATRGRMA